MLRNFNLAKRLHLLAFCFAIVLSSAGTSQAQDTVTLTNKKGETIEVIVGDDEKKDDRVPVDVAILLDTSNSMDGLINQARNQLWQIVQRLSVAEKDGRAPALRVSVFEYGNTNLPATENFIRQVLPLSDDLDKVSEALFGLKTSGGDEYCGAVIGEAIKRLDWSGDDAAYKSIFIAGNEPFTQGQISYLNTCADAKEKGIIVNTIHCGDHSTGVKGMWADGASKGAGQSFNINQDRKQVTIKCPQDKVLIELNTKLNKTYLWFGKKSVRKMNLSNQIAQDTNAAFGTNVQGAMGGMGGAGLGGGRMGGGMGGGGGMAMGQAPAPAFSGRVASKASKIYDNRSRDLVDAEGAEKGAVEKIEKDKLPEEMQKMSVAERKAHVAKKTKERKQIQEQIKKVAKEREAHLAAERKKQGEAGDTFGDAICAAIDKQLAEQGFSKTKR